MHAIAPARSARSATAAQRARRRRPPRRTGAAGAPWLFAGAALLGYAAALFAAWTALTRSQGWIRVPVGKTVDRKGRPLTVKLKGTVEAFLKPAPAAPAA